MNKHLGYRARHRSGRIRAGLLAAALTGAVVVPTAVLTGTPAAEAGVCPSPALKCYRVDLSPVTFTAGATKQFTAKITNESGGQSLGSSNLTAPAGYSVTHLDSPSRGSATLAGQTIQFRNMTLPVGQNVTLTFTATTPLGAGAASWASTAKQSNDYNGVGNDFVLDPASARTTTGSGTTATGCPAGDVSCGTNFIRYDQASTVSTGNAVNAAVWTIARMNFPATSVTGGQSYSIDALSNPGSFCPVDGSPTQCQFEVDIQTVPTPYDANHPVTLTITCDSSHCSSTTGLLVLVKKDGNGNNSLILPCPANILGDPCYSTSVNSDGDAVITVTTITAGDPKIAGIYIG